MDVAQLQAVVGILLGGGIAGTGMLLVLAWRSSRE